MNCSEWAESKRVWTDNWPTEEGHYWFYGSRWGDDPVGLHMVNVREGWAYGLGGDFIFEIEAKGVWQKAFVPKLPESI